MRVGGQSGSGNAPSIEILFAKTFSLILTFELMPLCSAGFSPDCLKSGSWHSDSSR